jgi:hypothetical protein
MNWFKRKNEKRMRTKIALNAQYGVNDLVAVQKFINGVQGDNDPLFFKNTHAQFTEETALSSKIEIDWTKILDDYFNKRKNEKQFIEGSFRDNAECL